MLEIDLADVFSASLAATINLTPDHPLGEPIFSGRHFAPADRMATHMTALRLTQLMMVLAGAH